MVGKSRHRDCLNSMKGMVTQSKESTQNRVPAQGMEAHSSPQSILAQLKSLNGQDAVVSVPIGGTNE